MNGLWLLLAPGTPVLLALFWALPAARPTVSRLAPVAALPALGIALFAPDTVLELSWVLFGARGVLDDPARAFLGFTALLWLIAGLYSNGYPGTDRSAGHFRLFWLMTLSGNLGLILTRDIAGFYAAFAVMTFSAYALVIHERNGEALRAGRVYLVMALLGEILLLAGLLLTALHARQPLLSEVPGVIASHEQGLLFAALLWLGFGVKAGLPLVHMWLALAHPVAPVPASAVLSGAMIKAGLLGWLLVLPAMPETPAAGTLVMGFGFFGAFGAALVGVCQHQSKKVLAYSSISQMGLMTVMVGAALLEPALHALLPAVIALYALHHGLAKGALFLGVSALPWPRYSRVGWLLLALPALALAGLPLTSGASAKIAMKEALESAVEPAAWWSLLPWLLGLGALGTTLLMARFLYCMTRETGNRPNAAATLRATWVLAVLSSLTGLWWLPHGVPSAETGLAPAKLAELLWPLLAGIALAVIAMRGRWRPVPIPAGDLVVPAEWLARYLLDGFLWWTRILVAVLRRLRYQGEQILDQAMQAGRWLVRGEESWRHNPAAVFVVLATLMILAFW